ncbi:MAG: metallophosphoesterase [Myxococcales bacterium]|nr:metallophosphoesterase [Myxococcales bacterium]
MTRRLRSLVSVTASLGAGAIALALALASLHSCAQPECVVPNYTDPECRVIVENELARLDAASGVEVRFVDPRGSDLDWDALGLVEEPAAGSVRARVASVGDFALRIRGDADEARTVDLELTNVDPRAVLRVGPVGDLDSGITLPQPGEPLLRRQLSVDVDAGAEVELRGELPCPERFTLAFVGDIQTNPTHFERILERIREDGEAAADAGAPLLGMVIVGDLTEWSNDEEFFKIRALLGNAPAPVAVTAGNHDIFRGAVAIYNSYFGPANYNFDVCGARVAMIDTASARLASSIEGRLGELVGRGDADLLIMATHYPPHWGLSGDGWSREDQPQLLLAELALAEADLIVAGHQHALRDSIIHVGGRDLRQIIVGTGGADQGLGVARFGYLRLRVDPSAGITPCFVEVPPPGWAGPANEPLASLPYCDT